MDTNTAVIVVVGLIILAFVAFGIVWNLRSRSGGSGSEVTAGFKTRLGEANVGFKDHPHVEKEKPRPEQSQENTRRSSQEMPAASGGKQTQKDTTDSSQKMS